MLGEERHSQKKVFAREQGGNIYFVTTSIFFVVRDEMWNQRNSY